MFLNMNTHGIWTILLKVYDSNKPSLAKQQIEATSIITAITSFIFWWVTSQETIKLPSDLFCPLPLLPFPSLNNWGTLLKFSAGAIMSKNIMIKSVSNMLTGRHECNMILNFPRALHCILQLYIFTPLTMNFLLNFLIAIWTLCFLTELSL